MSPFLFITDLDNTLVGDDAALVELNQILAAHREQYNSKIVYATGRSLYLYRLLAEAKSLLPPDALITAVGTEMYFDPEGCAASSPISNRGVDQQEPQYDQEWADILAQGWNREEIVAIANQFSDLQCQPSSEQNPFKISYYLAEAAAERTLEQLQVALQSAGFEIKLIYSAGQDLDLLPKNGDKGLAVQFLRRRWQIPPEQTIVCGDSGNDISMFEGQEKSLLVANAKAELLEWYQANQNSSNYLAKSDCAGGILEGLKHFGFI
jgi:sucrose-6-phosphatase